MNQSLGQLYPDPPYHYDRGDQVSVVFRTDRDLLGSLLPPVLELPDGPATAVARVVQQARSTFGPYVGVYLSVPALLDGRPVLHTLTGMKNSLSGAVAGREVWGMPLQVGDVDMAWRGDVLSIVAGRRGVDFLRMAVRLERRTDPPSGGPLNTYAARRPQFDEAPTEHVLVAVRGSVVDPAEITYWTARATLALPGGDPGDDWSVLPVREVLETRFNTGGRSSLDRGSVIAQW